MLVVRCRLRRPGFSSWCFCQVEVQLVHFTDLASASARSACCIRPGSPEMQNPSPTPHSTPRVGSPLWPQFLTCCKMQMLVLFGPNDSKKFLDYLWSSLSWTGVCFQDLCPPATSECSLTRKYKSFAAVTS